MKIVLSVKNFGKISQASVDISRFTIFVGNNNSGKTYLMQLIYGLLKHIRELNQRKIDADFIDLEHNFILDSAMYDQINTRLNAYFQEKKEDIVKQIFHENVSIEELHVEIIPEDGDEISVQYELQEDHKIQLDDAQRKNIPIIWTTICYKQEEKELVHGTFGMLKKKDRDIDQMRRAQIYHEILKAVFLTGTMKFADQALYLPASRTGILLLYKYFFSERDQNTIPLLVESEEKKDFILMNHAYSDRNDMGLTAPVYDFLQFLLRYSQGEGTDLDKELLSFIQNHLLDGSIESNMGSFVYKQNNSDTVVPLYLASSMVNELTPIVMALSNRVRYRYILYDEIETCLHPMKQKEMARLLNRMSNQGYRLIVSTHSDTMAAKLNNLFLLSFMEDKEKQKEKMQRLGLEEADLLQNEKVNVYQFTNQPNGTSVVEEMNFQTTPYMGYDFSMFAESSEELYKESEIILEDE